MQRKIIVLVILAAFAGGAATTLMQNFTDKSYAASSKSKPFDEDDLHFVIDDGKTYVYFYNETESEIWKGAVQIGGSRGPRIKWTLLARVDKP